MTTYAGVKAWRAANPDKVAAQARRYRARHPDKVKVIKERYRENGGREIDTIGAARRRAANPEARKQRYLTWRERREAGLALLAGRPRAVVCELCSTEGRTVFDHNHATGRFRGWICDRCNKVLGLLRDDPELMRAMAAYVEEH